MSYLFSDSLVGKSEIIPFCGNTWLIVYEYYYIFILVYYYKDVLFFFVSFIVHVFMGRILDHLYRKCIKSEYEKDPVMIFFFGFQKF